MIPEKNPKPTISDAIKEIEPKSSISDSMKEIKPKPSISGSIKNINPKPTVGPYIIISDGDESEQSDSNIWVNIHGITLTEEDKSIILEGRWLNDKIIHAMQLLMKNDPNLLPVSSLQNPILGQTLVFDIATDESVQILHSGGNHWLTISTVGEEHPAVNVYDSVNRPLPFSTKQQIAALLHIPQRAVTLKYASIQVSEHVHVMKTCAFMIK